MNIEEFVKLYHQIMENNSWKHMLKSYLKDASEKPMIKYIQFTVDTRDGDIYSLVTEPFSKDFKRFQLDDPEELKQMKSYLKLE